MLHTSYFDLYQAMSAIEVLCPPLPFAWIPCTASFVGAIPLGPSLIVRPLDSLDPSTVLAAHVPGDGLRDADRRRDELGGRTQ